MADTVTTKTLFESPTKLVIHLTSLSDGTGESNVVKVDKSTLIGTTGSEPANLTIEKIVYDVSSIRVTLTWDETVDETIAVLQGFGKIDWYEDGKHARNEGVNTGGTGDILLTTANTAVGDGYDITIYMKKED